MLFRFVFFTSCKSKKSIDNMENRLSLILILLIVPQNEQIWAYWLFGFPFLCIAFNFF